MSLVADFGDVLALLGLENYELVPGTVPTVIGGVVAPVEPPESRGIAACIQPLTGRDLQRLPEGDRSTEQVWCFTQDAVSAADSAAGRTADTIVFNGVPFEVQTVERWSQGNFYKARCAKVTR